MPRRRRIVVPLLAVLVVIAAVVIAGCGGGGSSSASSSTPVDQLLRDTFTGNKHVTSGRLDLTLRVDAQGGTVNGPIAVHLSGPFQSLGKGRLPKFDMTLALQGAGQNLTAGLVSTGDKGFVRFQAQTYAITPQIFAQFKKGYEQAQSQAKSGQSHSLASLGIDPRSWLTNARNAGDAKVGDTDTIRITGGVNLPKLLDDVNTLLTKTKQLGGSAASSIPQQLTPQEKTQATKAVKSFAVDFYTGKDDKILRRMVLALGLQIPQSSTSAGGPATLRLDVQLLDVNQSQSINAPAGAKPFSQLLSLLGGLGLGSSLGSSGSSGSTGGASAGSLQKYTQCIQKAGSNAAKARKCANLLTP
jgi:hypothetical protein